MVAVRLPSLNNESKNRFSKYGSLNPPKGIRSLTKEKRGVEGAAYTFAWPPRCAGLAAVRGESGSDAPSWPMRNAQSPVDRRARKPALQPRRDVGKCIEVDQLRRAV